MSSLPHDRRVAAPADPKAVRHWRDMLRTEREAAELYERVAAAETGERAEILRELAAVERRHAAHWEERLRAAGLPVPAPTPAGLRTRLLSGAARWLSTDAVLPLLERAERAGAGVYDSDPDAAPGMAADERGHARALSALRAGSAGVSWAVAEPGSAEPRSAEPEGAGPGGAAAEVAGGSAAGRGGAAVPAAVPAPAQPPQLRIGRREQWHRGDRSGALRAAIFGISDGLVSNTALVMGFAGSGAAREPVLLAGIAGLLAGSFSMAAGEYVSMSGQREMFERELALEAAELDENPQEELEELVLLYRAKGLGAEQARQIAERIMSDREVALDTLAREELGLDPDALGSPWHAAGASFLAFAVGAVLVVLPYLFGGGTAALITAAALALVSMFVVGAGMGLLNARSVLRSGTRQVLVGALAAAVTYGVGALIGGVTG